MSIYFNNKSFVIIIYFFGMDLDPVDQFCKRGDLENIKKLFLEEKLTKEIIFSKKYNCPFDLAYANGHFDVCKFLIFNFNITKKDILKYTNYYIFSTLNKNSDDINVKYVNFLIEEFGITEEDLADYLKGKGEGTRNIITECFMPLGSFTKTANF